MMMIMTTMTMKMRKMMIVNIFNSDFQFIIEKFFS